MFGMGHRPLPWHCDESWALFSFDDDDGGDAYDSWLDYFAKVIAYENLIALRFPLTDADTFSYFDSCHSATG